MSFESSHQVTYPNTILYSTVVTRVDGAHSKAHNSIVLAAVKMRLATINQASFSGRPFHAPPFLGGWLHHVAPIFAG